MTISYDSLSSSSEGIAVTYGRIAQFTHLSQQLTTAEKVAKWSLKVIAMIAGVIVGAVLGGLLSAAIPIPFLGAGIGGGLAFIATMYALGKIDEYFTQRASKRAIEHAQPNQVT